jgi:hypothetical protein
MLWEQREPILDVALAGDAMLVLSPSGVALFERRGGHWEPRRTNSFPAGTPMPRDPRGRMRIEGSAFQAFLPGMTCTGELDSAAAPACHAADDPWPIQAGPAATVSAHFSPERNYFDGRLSTAPGIERTLPPFYSAAAAEDQGKPVWLAALLNGGTGIFGIAPEPAGMIAGWGSDIAPAGRNCAGTLPVLASRPGAAADHEAVQAYAIVNRASVPMGAPAEFSGLVTALWPVGDGLVLAVSRNAAGGTYEAWLLTVDCGA